MERFERSDPRELTGHPAQLLRQWENLLAELEAVSDGVIDRSEIDAAMVNVHRYIRGRQEMLRERVQPVDPLSLVASRAADHEHDGHVDRAALELDVYRRQSGDAFPTSLAHLYSARRAMTRSKVACQQAAESSDNVAPANTAGRRLFDLASRHLRAASVRLVLVGGLPGTGKSTVAAAVHAVTGWPVLSSDLLQRRLAGLDAAEDTHGAFGTGLYAPESTATVYSELLEEAGALLRGGYSVILDAAWTRRSWRDAAGDVARLADAELISLQCEARLDLSAVAIAEAMSAAMEPWVDSVAIDTSCTYTETVFSALEVIGIAPEVIPPVDADR